VLPVGLCELCLAGLDLFFVNNKDVCRTDLIGFFKSMQRRWLNFTAGSQQRMKRSNER